MAMSVGTGAAAGVASAIRAAPRCCSSYRRVAAAVCAANLVAAIVALRAFYSPLLLGGAGGGGGGLAAITRSFSGGLDVNHKLSNEQIRRMEDSIRIRKAMVPVELVSAVKRLREVLIREEKRRAMLPPQSVMRALAGEIVERLKSLGENSSVSEQREVLEAWRSEKLKDIATTSVQNASTSAFTQQEATMLKQALESNWLNLLENIGLWIPDNVTNPEHNDKPENEPDEEIIPGPPMPPECHAEPHTDYDGAAVRWGLTHHKESAAECCQACIDQAKHAGEGELKCNIWVYCPSEFGCHSPDIYEHKHQECWLKQADTPRLNFKDRYAEPYRDAHPNAPVVVPWMSGVVTA